MESRTGAWQLLALFLLAVAAPAQTSMVVVPEALSFAAPARTAPKSVATLSVFTTPPNLPLTAEVRYLGQTTGWLEVSPLKSSATPATLTVTANPANLEPGTYTAQITLLAGNLGRAINVTLAIGNPTSAKSLLVSPTTMTFTAIAGQVGPISQGLSVSSPAGTSEGVSFRVSTSAPAWLWVPPLPFKTPAVVPIQAHPAVVPAGVYSGTVSVTPESGGLPTVVPVTMVSLGYTGSAPELLQLSQTLISLRHQPVPSSPKPPAQTVRVETSSGYTGQPYTATAVTAPGDPAWITLSSPFSESFSTVAEGYTGTDFTVQIEPALLPEPLKQTYSGRIEVTSPGLPTVNLPVRLDLTGQGLNANPSSVVLKQIDSELASAAVVVTSISGSLSVTASASPEWLSVTPSPTVVTAGTGQTFTITANGSTLKPGTYEGFVSISAGQSSSLVIPVRFIDITDAAESEIVSSPSEVNLFATPNSANPSAIVALRVCKVLYEAPPPEGTCLPAVDHDFTVAATSTGGWLTVLPYGGRTPASITATANLAAVSGPGPHTGSIVVTSLLNNLQYTIPVTLNIGEPAISVDPPSISFTQERRGAEFARKTVQVTSPVPAAFRVVQSPPWIRLGGSTGNTPGTLTLWPEQSLLPPGSNSGVIRIAGPRNEVTLAVTAALWEPAAPQITPESVNISYSFGAPAPSQSLAIAVEGSAGTFTARAVTDSGASWLIVSPASGAAPGEVTISVDPDRLITGQNKGVVTFNVTANGATTLRNIPVTVVAGPPDNTIYSVRHAATLQPTAVSPGLIVSIAGSGLGPAAGTVARPSSAGAYETRVGDIRVTFDGAPAPLLFVREDQINAIVPYSVFGRVTTKVRVEKGQSWSLPVELRVVDAAPGIFTAGGTGRGQAAAVNADLSANSAAAPAPRGSVVTLFATGEGQTDPGGQDGRVILTDVRLPLLPVTARVAGRPAEVLYAGSAPTQVSGMFQVNIRIPGDAPSGVVPVEILVGGVTSQPGLTLVVQ